MSLRVDRAKASFAIFFSVALVIRVKSSQLLFRVLCFQLLAVKRYSAK